MIALPAYIDAEAWSGFVDMRKTIKKPLTTRAAKLILYELQRLKDAGHDPNAALDQSTNHCWADVYMPKGKEISRAERAESTEDYLARIERERQAEAQRVSGPSPEVKRKMEELGSRLRRVA